MYWGDWWVEWEIRLEKQGASQPSHGLCLLNRLGQMGLWVDNPQVACDLRIP